MLKIRDILVFVIVLLSPVGGAWAQTPTLITVSLTDYAFTPSALSMKEGMAYQIHFINDSSKGHSFSAPGFFAASLVAPEDMAKVKNGMVELDSGQSADVTVTPGHAGTYAFICTHFMHQMMGMHGEIAVQ
jgi:plastocyanin